MLFVRKSMLDYETDVLEATAKLGYNKGEILHNALKMVTIRPNI